MINILLTVKFSLALRTQLPLRAKIFLSTYQKMYNFINNLKN